MKKKVYIVCGPTSSGKTSLAIELCKKYGGEIISADSRQVCRGMDIGTGKVPLIRRHSGKSGTGDITPSGADSIGRSNSLQSDGVGGGTTPSFWSHVGRGDRIWRGAKHWTIDEVRVWGYDLFSPDEYFSGVDWAEFALEKTREILDRGENVYIVGGTGFYLDLFTGRVKPSSVKPDFKLREELEKMSLGKLQKKLERLNKKELEKIDGSNKVRLIRAIEKEISEEESGVKLSYLDTEYVWIGLTAPREVLYKRVDEWVDKVWKNGLIDETKKLIERYPDSSKLQGLVYKSVLEYLNGKLKEKEALERTKYDLHAYIRRQQTYFKKNKDIIWVDISKDGFKQIIYNIIDG